MCSFWRLLSLAQCKLITTSCHNSTLKKLNLTLKLHHLIPEGSNWEPKFEFNQRNMVLCQFCFWNEIYSLLKKIEQQVWSRQRAFGFLFCEIIKLTFLFQCILHPIPGGVNIEGSWDKGFKGGRWFKLIIIDQNNEEEKTLIVYVLKISKIYVHM